MRKFQVVLMAPARERTTDQIATQRGIRRAIATAGEQIKLVGGRETIQASEVAGAEFTSYAMPSEECKLAGSSRRSFTWSCAGVLASAAPSQSSKTSLHSWRAESKWPSF